MKPISLKFSAFGAYLKEQTIDFSKISKDGIFLICGKTGSGKTVILDAICYALFGRSSGGIRGDISSMRCQLAQPSEPTYVEFIFDLAGKRYKFERTIKMGRKNMNTSQNALYMDENGSYIPFFENPKQRMVEEKAAELLGLSYDQFRQVIILPQGQFEKLLISKSEEKEEILVSLFNAGDWQKAADYLSEKLNRERRDLDEQFRAIDQSIKAWKCESYSEFSELSDKIEKSLREKTADLETHNKKLKEKRDELNVKTSLLNDFLKLEKQMDEYDKLSKSDESIKAMSKKLVLSQKADKIKVVYDKYLVAFNNEKLRLDNMKKQSKRVEKLKSDAICAKEAFRLLSSKTEENQKDSEKLVRLSQTVETYEQIDLINKELIEAEERVKKHKAALSDKENKLLKKNDEKFKLENELTKLFDKHSKMVEEYVHEMSGSLARELKDNAPCPVCGSLSHPRPASFDELTITNQMIKASADAIEDKKKKVALAGDSCKKLSDDLDEEKKLFQSEEVNREKLMAKSEELNKSKDSEFESKKDLVKYLENLQAQIDDFTKSLAEGQKSLNDSEQKLFGANETLKLMEDEHKKAIDEKTNLENDLNLSLLEHSFPNIDSFLDVLLKAGEKKSFEEKVKNHEIEKKSILNNIDDLKKRLSDAKKPNISELSKKTDEMEKEQLSLNSEISVMENDSKRLNALCKELDAKIKAFDEKNNENNENLRFVKQLRGDNGVSLERYILGVMLGSITREANRLLANVHNGRYQLYRTLETTGRARKSGLELEVFDSLSGERRSVTTLSGGEKFLVSLSLSIGLSTVVQAGSGGISLDSMFIDEGFGSLDPTSVGDALLVLSSMKKTNGVVGIISHVDFLKENITSQIQVVKEKTGSRIQIIGN